MTVSEVMSAGVQTVSPGMPAANARERMKAKRIHHLLVQEGTALVGVLSARDLARSARRGGSTVKRLLVADFMTPRVVTVTPDTSVRRAANVMRGQSIGCLIVVDKGGAVGIVTVADLLDQIHSRRHRVDRQTPPDLHYRVPHRKQRRAGGAW